MGWRFSVVAVAMIAGCVRAGFNPAPDDEGVRDGAPTSCGGVERAGACWYLGSLNESCTSVCSTRGGLDSATIDYAGSGGTADQCSQLVWRLAPTGTPKNGAHSQMGKPLGCAYAPEDEHPVHYSTPATTSAARDPELRRACACGL